MKKGKTEAPKSAGKKDDAKRSYDTNGRKAGLRTNYQVTSTADKSRA